MMEVDDIIEDPLFTRIIAPCSPHLRHYQIEAYTQIGVGWAKVRKQLAIMATGTGKTVLMGEVANEEVKAGGRVLLLAHRDELLDQAMEKFMRESGLPAAKEKAAERSCRHDRVVVASVQTLARHDRLHEFASDAFTVIMVDESHRILAKSYQVILNHFPMARVLGVTATADRGDKKELGTYFERIAIDYGIKDACKDGWLVRPVIQTLPLKIDLNAVKTRGSDFDAIEVAHAIEPFLMEIAENVRLHAGHLKTVIFMPSIDTSVKLTAALNSVGMNASFVSGECKDRSAKIKAFEGAGTNSVICNAMLLTEGWDCPDVSCVICLRPTKIRGLYCQMVGRGTRPHPSIVKKLNACADREERAMLLRKSVKPRLIILDFLWIYEKHDLCRGASLISADVEKNKRMRTMGDGDLLEQEAKAEADATEKLKKELQKNKDKAAKLIDPLDVSKDFHDPDLARYTPETSKDALPPNSTQMAVLQKEGVNPYSISSFGHAEKLIEAIMVREEKGMSSLRQLHFLKKLNIDASLYTHEEAQKLIKKKIGGWHNGGR